MKKTIVLLAVSALVLAMAPAAQAELVTHYKLDETSGTTASDATGNGNDGTVDSSFGSTAGSPDPTSALAYSTANNGDLVNGVTGLASNNTSFTIMFWLDGDFSSGYSRFLSIGEDVGEAEEIVFAAGVYSPTEAEYEAQWYNLNAAVSAEAPAFFVEEPVSWLSNDWQHHAATVDGSTVTWFVDGVQRATGTIPGTGTVDASKFFILGSPTQGDDRAGSVDEVGVFDTVLDQTAIQGYMNDGIGGTPSVRGTVLMVR